MEFSQVEICDLEAEVKTLRKSEREHKTRIEELKTRIEDLEQQTNCQEDYSQRNNIRISGVKDLPNGEIWEQTATQFSALLQDKLQLTQIKVGRAHRVGPPGRSAPRTIAARFNHFCAHEAVMWNAGKLRVQEYTSTRTCAVLHRKLSRANYTF